MNRWSRRISLLMLVCGLCTTLGCAVLHDLKPHRLQRLNRGPAVGSGALYSVADPSVPTVSRSQEDPCGLADEPVSR